MSYWLGDPELFLYAKGIGPNDVHLWRCKKPASSSSLIVPMKPNDFDYVSNVKNHLELIDDLFDWDELDYKRLVEYIYEKRLLVNGQGLVIAKLLQKGDKDGNKTIDDANEEDVPAIYIRSLDVLPLNSYIPNLSERLIPLRTVKYLGDVNGKAAMMKEDSNVTKLTARVDNLEAENIRLESKNNTLDSNVTKLTADLTTITYQVVALQSRITNVESNVAKVIQHLYQMDPGYREVWMNDRTQFNWVGIENLRDYGEKNFTFIGPQDSYIKGEISKYGGNNVRATYLRRAAGYNSYGNAVDYAVISVEDLTPYKEKARFEYYQWCTYKYQGKVYVTYPS